jgi:hypothetical protein
VSELECRFWWFKTGPYLLIWRVLFTPTGIHFARKRLRRMSRHQT